MTWAEYGVTMPTRFMPSARTASPIASAEVTARHAGVLRHLRLHLGVVIVVEQAGRGLRQRHDLDLRIAQQFRLIDHVRRPCWERTACCHPCPNGPCGTARSRADSWCIRSRPWCWWTGSARRNAAVRSGSFAIVSSPGNMQAAYRHAQCAISTGSGADFQHGAREAAEHRLPQPRVAIAAHHQQAAARFRRRVQQQRDRRAGRRRSTPGS